MSCGFFMSLSVYFCPKALNISFLLSYLICVNREQVAELMTKRGLMHGFIMVRLVLLMLSTRLGTLLLCGSLCFSKEFPFVKKFKDISLEKRDRILQNWSRSKYIILTRAAFAMIKSFCFYIFFTRVRL